MSRDLDPKHWQEVRPQVALLAAQGLRNEEIATRLDCPRDRVSEWRRRFYAQGRMGLDSAWPTLPNRDPG
jgi:hypothetical protein